MNFTDNQLAPPNGTSLAIERQLLQFLRNSEIDLNSRFAIKNARMELTRLIEDWNSNHQKRSIADVSAFSEKVLRNLIGFGPIEPLLENNSIWEISINGPKEIFIRSHDSIPSQYGDTFHDEAHLERVLGRILETCVGSTKQLDPSLGVQDAQLPDGTRIHIVHPEITRNYQYAVSIRKFANNRYESIEDFVACGSMSEQVGDFLHNAINLGVTILISGAPGSGKTTLLNALLGALPSSKRIIAIEETPEIKISQPDRVQLHTRTDRPGRNDIDLRKLVKASLRMNSEVLILGEVRDNESLALLLSLSTGIQGMSTIHASTCKDALARLRLLVQLSLESAIPIWSTNQIIANAIGLVIQMKRSNNKIMIDEIISLEEGSKDLDIGFITTEIFHLDESESSIRFSGNNPLKIGQLQVNRALVANLKTNPDCGSNKRGTL